jgi:hypothetical protein
MTDLGQSSVFRFTLGEVATITAVVCAFCAGREGSKLAIFGMSAWLFIGLSNFSWAIWPSLAK